MHIIITPFDECIQDKFFIYFIFFTKVLWNNAKIILKNEIEKLEKKESQICREVCYMMIEYEKETETVIILLFIVWKQGF